MPYLVFFSSKAENSAHIHVVVEMILEERPLISHSSSNSGQGRCKANRILEWLLCEYVGTFAIVECLMIAHNLFDTCLLQNITLDFCL